MDGFGFGGGGGGRWVVEWFDGWDGDVHVIYSIDRRVERERCLPRWLLFYTILYLGVTQRYQDDIRVDTKLETLVLSSHYDSCWSWCQCHCHLGDERPPRG
jgi:hypothetical protein